MPVDLDKLNKIFKSVKKEMGDSVVVERKDNEKIKRIPSRSPSLAYAFGGGHPVGRIIEGFGWESSGKSLLAYLMGADFQAVGEFVAYIDTEFAFDYEFAEKQGLSTDPDKFQLFQPRNLEEAFEIAEELSNAGVGLIIFDSVSTMKPKAEEEADYGTATMGNHARGMSQGLRKITSLFNENKTSAYFINQYRQKFVLHGDNRTTSGGNALKFYASIRFEVSKSNKEDIYENGEFVGGKIKIKVPKNKTAPKGKEVMLSYRLDSGIDTDFDYVNFAVRYGIIEKGGAWYNLPDGTKFQGLEKTLEYLKEHSDTFNEIKGSVDRRISGESKNTEIIEKADEEETE